MELVENFPAECRQVLETLREVYKNDAEARTNEMTPAERLQFHQTKSGPLMTGLETWMRGQLADHKVEPNSRLGDAIRYMLKHWLELTLFLREPGAPLDNNLCERSLKRAILHRKNSLFYQTLSGAHVGDAKGAAVVAPVTPGSARPCEVARPRALASGRRQTPRLPR